MDLPYSNIDNDFLSLLEVKGGFLKRLFFRNIVNTSKSFYKDYVSWCAKNNKYIDFIQPLCWHLYCFNFAGWKIRLYLKIVGDGIRKYVSDNMKQGGQNND